MAEYNNSIVVYVDRDEELDRDRDFIPGTDTSDSENEEENIRRAPSPPLRSPVQKCDKRKKPAGQRVVSDTTALTRAVKMRAKTMTAKVAELNKMVGVAAYFGIRRKRCKINCPENCESHLVDYFNEGNFFEIPRKRTRSPSTYFRENNLTLDAVVDAVGKGFERAMEKIPLSNSASTTRFNSPTRGSRHFPRGSCFHCKRNRALVGGMEVESKWISCNVPSCEEKTHLICTGWFGSEDEDDSSMGAWFCTNHRLQGFHMLRGRRGDSVENEAE